MKLFHYKKLEPSPASAHFATCAFLLLLALTPHQVSAASTQTDTLLTQYIEEALQENPDLQAWHARIEAAGYRVSQVGAWSDPSLSVSIMNIPTNSFDLNQEPMTGIWINASQAIPLTRRFSVQSEIAGRSLERDQAMLMGRQQAIADQVAQMWYEWAFQQAAVATIDTTLQLIDGLVDLSLIRYETGKGLQQDVLRLQTERIRFEDRRVQRMQEARTTGRRFAVLLGRSPEETIAPPTSLPEDLPVLDEVELKERLHHANPAIRGKMHETRISAEKVSQAKRALWPDLRLNAGYGFRQQSDLGMERPDFLTVGVGMNLPLFAGSKQKPAIEEAVAGNRQAEQQLRDTEQNIHLMLASLLDQDNRLAEQIALYRHGLLPQAEATVEASTAAWSTGKVDVDALLNTQIALLNARLELLARLRDRAKTRSAIEALFADKNSSMTPDSPAQPREIR